MADRKYSLKELDRMRKAIRLLDRKGGTDVEMTVRREEHLRTYMTNGTAPEELESAAEEAWGCPIGQITGWP